MLLVVKINGSMLSVQHINDNMEKYVSIPQSWRCKNCAFEYVDSINTVTQREVVCDLRNASCHSLVVDRSIDVSIIKMLILYAKFRPRNGTSYKTVFAEILQLTFTIDDPCNYASLMQDIETLHRTVYTLFCRSSVKKIAFKELAEVLECKLIAFKPLNKVR